MASLTRRERLIHMGRLSREGKEQQQTGDVQADVVFGDPVQSSEVKGVSVASAVPGIMFMPSSTSTDKPEFNFVISDIKPQTSAEVSGLRVGDVIAAVDDVDILGSTSPGTISNMLIGPFGSELNITCLRKGDVEYSFAVKRDVLVKTQSSPQARPEEREFVNPRSKLPSEQFLLTPRIDKNSTSKVIGNPLELFPQGKIRDLDTTNKENGVKRREDKAFKDDGRHEKSISFADCLELQEETPQPALLPRVLDHSPVPAPSYTDVFSATPLAPESGNAERKWSLLSGNSLMFLHQHSDGDQNLEPTGSIVNMLHREIFAAENSNMSFTLFRVYNIQEPLTVRCSTVEGFGSAISHKHFVPASQEVKFEAGSALAHIKIQILDDQNWDPIRDFSVQIDSIIQGNGIIGRLNFTTCYIVDDDIYPRKVDRTARYPLKPEEARFPSCISSDQYLTPDELQDSDLIINFIRERFHATYPSSVWALFWAIYRGGYRVFMTYTVKVFVDLVWLGTLSDSSVWYAVAFSAAVLVTSFTTSFTNSWMISNMKAGFTVKQLRDAAAAQLLWADDGRSSLQTCAYYLNSCISEVESAAEIYLQFFPAIEIIAHFLFSIVMILAVFPLAAPLVFVLAPIVFFVQKLRAPELSRLLVTKQKCERNCVALLSEVIENTHTFRSMPGASLHIQQELAAETGKFSRATLDAVLYNTRTIQYIQVTQAFMFSSMLLASCFMVNTGFDWGGLVDPATPGSALMVITAFIHGSNQLIELSSIVLKMRFHSEGLRSVAKVLNFPTDAHKLAQNFIEKEEIILGHMTGGDGGLRRRKKEKMGLNDEKWSSDELEWVDCIHLNETFWLNPIAQTLHSHDTATQTDKLVCISARFQLGGVCVLQAPSDQYADTVLKLIKGLAVSENMTTISNIYVPPFLKYAYVPESPVLVEGSILKNLLMGAEHQRSLCKRCKQLSSSGPKHLPESCRLCKRVSSRQAWEVAERCGLDTEFLHAPESFSVGKNGRNLPLAQRQAVSIARGLLANASVILLHKPTALLSNEHAEKVLEVLDDFQSKGGLFGMIGTTPLSTGLSPKDYLTGSEAPTIILTVSHGNQIPSIATRVLECSFHETILKKDKTL